MSHTVTYEPFKGRSVYREHGALIHAFVYRNLHTGRWSVKALNGPYRGLVVAHADEVGVWAPQLQVNESGRQRVIREGKKNVHAGVVGQLASVVPDNALAKMRTKITYNPYQFSTFVKQVSAPASEFGTEFEPITKASFAELAADGRAYAYNPR